MSYGGAAALSVADRQLCFPRSDATCTAQLVGADRDFRNLLRNGCLSSLREVDYELEYLARCQVSKPLSRPILLAHHNSAMTPLRLRRDVSLPYFLLTAARRRAPLPLSPPRPTRRRSSWRTACAAGLRR